MEIKDINIKETDLLTDISTFQEAEKLKSKKYKFQKEAYNKDEKVYVETHEYLCPDGSIGYQVFFKIKDNDKIYIKSKGVGKEAEHRDFDWQELKEDII